MNITLSWDLFIIVFFALVMSYSFIIGKNQSVKVIIASYIAIIATQGIGNVIARLIGQSKSLSGSAGFSLDLTSLSIAKIALFAVFIILFSIRSGIHVSYTKESGSIMNLIFTALYGFFTAALIVSTILTYAAGSAILDMKFAASSALMPAVNVSRLMQVMVLNQDIWFTLPALLIVAAGFLNNE